MAKICRAMGLSQSNVAHRVSVSLADDRQNMVQVTTKSKCWKNTIEQLHRKQLRRNHRRKNKIRKMSRKEKCTFFKHKAMKDFVKMHNEEIAQNKEHGTRNKKKSSVFLEKMENNATSTFVSERPSKVQ